MRTGSPAIGGGGPSMLVRPSPTATSSFGAAAGFDAADRNTMQSKSPRFIEAAMVIAGMSGGSIVTPASSDDSDESSSSIRHQQHRAVLSEGADSCRNGYGPSEMDEATRIANGHTRFSHIKTAVMPERHSYVQRALKRKIETRMESSAPASDCPTRDERVQESSSSDEEGTGPLQKAIASERGYFDSVKRYRAQSEFEIAKPEEDVGRFVRTCRPHRQTDADVCPKVLHFDVISPLGRRPEGMSSVISPADNNFGKFGSDQDRAERLWSMRQNGVGMAVDKGSPSDRLSIPAPLSTVENGHRKSFHSHNDMRAEVRPVPSVFPGMPAMQTVAGSRTSCGSDMRRHIPLQQACYGASSARELPSLNRVQLHQLGNGGHIEKDIHGRKNANLSAYYSLGRHVASALTSPVSCLPKQNRQRASYPQNYSHQRIESRQMYVPANNKPDSRYYKFGGVANQNKKPRILDSQTENKVKNGEFGSLRTLQDFYKKLDGRDSKVDPKPVVRGRLGSITNCSLYQMYRSVKNVEENFNGWKNADIAKTASCEETAMDLSLHSSRKQLDAVDDQCSRYELLRLGRGSRRISRSCCSSPHKEVELPAAHVADGQISNVETKRTPMNPTSLPSSPFPLLSLANVKLETVSSPGSDHGVDDQEVQKESRPETSVTDTSTTIKADSRLPLKKRRLLDVDISLAEEKLALPSKTEASDGSDQKSLLTVKRESNIDSDDVGAIVRTKSASVMSAIRCDEDGDLPLHIAVAQSNLPAVEQILDIMKKLGMSLDYYNNLKQTPLHVAVLTDQPSIVRRLLVSGSSPNVVDRHGYTSLHHASRLPSTRCLECLIDHSKVPLSVNALTYSGLTALHLAVECGNPRAVTSLIDADARVDACDGTNGRTPLFFAVEQNNVEIAKILLACGANPSIPTYSGCSPARVAFAPRCRTDVSRLFDVYATTDVKG